jgi:AcrR family transcriptional regulator
MAAASSGVATGDLPARTRQRLLEAAEELFAARGFRAASVRAITTRAGCNLAAVNYHFGGKRGLYREMFRRRISVLRSQRIRGARRAFEEAGEQAVLEVVLRAFTTAFLEPHLDESSGRRLMQLFSRELLDPQLPPGTLSRQLIAPVQAAFIKAIRSTGLDLGPREARRCAQSVVAQLVHVVRMRGMPRTNGPARGDFAFPGMVDHIVRFSAAGLRSCAGTRR